MDKNSKKNNTESFPKVGINWYPGHMAKTKREITKNLSLIDVVYELIDARIPFSSKNIEITDITKNKPRLLIMTKSDLCDLDKTGLWKKYYENLGYKVILVDLLKGKNSNEIIKMTEDLYKPILEKRLKQGLLKRKIRVLVVGVPNVGKSTLINQLVHKKVVGVGNKPGVTKQLNWIRINEKIELLDTPGILWPKLDNCNISYNLASLTAIKEEILDNADIGLYIINKLLINYPNLIKNRYNISSINNDDIINEIGIKIGAIKNKEIDYNRVYKTIINDLREGRLGKITFDNIE